MNMKVAIVFDGQTGNIETVAEAVRKDCDGETILSFGRPEAANVEKAELIFVGTWIDKGSCTATIAHFLAGLRNKKVARFGTAGFGADTSYIHALYERIGALLPKDCRLLDETFFSLGKMPISVRERYVSMLRSHPDDRKLQVDVRNFDEALSQPDEQELNNAADFAARALAEAYDRKL